MAQVQHTNGGPQQSRLAAVTPEALPSEVERIFEAQRAHQNEVAQTTAKERKQKLKRLHQALLGHRQEIQKALYEDFHKHPSEVDLTEIYPVTSEIKHASRHLSGWMRPRRVKTPIALMGSRSYIHYEPKGVVLIISPWNFPVNLTFGPLTAAIAAGNCVMIKPSENTPHASAIMKKIVEETFEENEVALVEGAVDAAQAVLARPFNHIFFTGSPNVGKIVMKAAAEHLGSVTLELGGKSPTIVDETANIDAAARRIAWAKYLNNGQICITPDYLFVHEARKEEFIDKVRQNIRAFYGSDAHQSPSYSRIVNDHHFRRVAGYLEDARANGAKVVEGGHIDETDNYIEPTILTDVDPSSDVMTNEIFGPILPVFSFRNLDEAIESINSREKPLALYIYSKSKKNIDHVIRNTRAGGTCINHNAVHFFNNNLPFGGSNHSGIGKGHGFFGFQAFSNPRGVLKQMVPFSALELMMAPYTKLKQALIDLSIKWF